MGIEAECEVLARKHAEGPQTVYSDCSVIGAPEELPEGDYRVTFEGYWAVATKRRGLWLPAGAAHRTT